jgi:glycosyltransferase involved in cell wall biosynthesis
VALEKLGARFCDVFISVGEDVKEKYLRESIGRGKRYVTVHSGMDTSSFARAREHRDDVRSRLRTEFGFAADDVVVGMVSRLEARKGYGYLFEAVARLAPDFPPLRVLVVGEGAEREALRRRTEELGIAERVVFAGYREDVADVIAAFDVAVLTSLWEGLPRVLVQYSLMEKPIVTFEVEGSREVVNDGVSGYVVPQKDVEALVDRLRRLVASAALREEFGALARERVEGRWDKDLMVRRISDVYETAGAERGLPTAPVV